MKYWPVEKVRQESFAKTLSDLNGVPMRGGEI